MRDGVDTVECDVVIAGSGAGGMLAAVRAHDLGLQPVVIEKSERYGGTSAVSGGAIWIPNNADIAGRDSPEKALNYLMSVTAGAVAKDKLARYVDVSPVLTAYLKSIGVDYYSHPEMSSPDYYPGHPGALDGGRTMYVKPVDGRRLGDAFFHLRESYPEFKLFGRITLDLPESGQVVGQYKGWQATLVRAIMRYYSNLGWRRRTRRDDKLALGNALIGGLRIAMQQRSIPLYLRTELETIVKDDNGRVTGIEARRDGSPMRINAAKGVVIASGGFEQSQQMRSSHLAQHTEPRWSATPRDNNQGDGLRAASAAGAATEFLDEAWWAPTIATPHRTSPNGTRAIALFWERGFPHGLCVNRLGRRFVDEACSYHQFGQAMLRDNLVTKANLPCWMIFDAQYRRKYMLGALLPGKFAPDSTLPPDWFDSFLYRSDTLAGLAAKIGMPASALAETVSRFNGFAESGIDKDFGRGGNVYDRSLGDPRHTPNPNLGPLMRAPFYAVRLDLGDLGTKGGPKTDLNANVLDTSGKPIPGLYAVGNAAGSAMGGAYPGAGATLGAAMTFAYVAATHIAGRNSFD